MDLFLKYLSSARNGEDTWVWNVLYTCGSDDRGVAEKSLLKEKKKKIRYSKFCLPYSFLDSMGYDQFCCSDIIYNKLDLNWLQEDNREYGL